MSATAKDVLATKAAPLLHTCSPATTVKDAANLMSVHHVGSLLVAEDGGAMQGIFTERDVLMRVVAQGRNADATPVSEVMSKSLVTIAPETPIEEIERIMADNRIRHLPVLQNGKLVAVLSIRDVLVFHAESRKQMVEQLTDYMAGNYR